MSGYRMPSPPLPLPHESFLKVFNAETMHVKSLWIQFVFVFVFLNLERILGKFVQCLRFKNRSFKIKDPM